MAEKRKVYDYHGSSSSYKVCTSSVICLVTITHDGNFIFPDAPFYTHTHQVLPAPLCFVRGLCAAKMLTTFFPIQYCSGMTYQRKFNPGTK